MKTRFEFKNNKLYVIPTGDIDHHSAKTVREEIDFEMYKYTPEEMIIDLGNIDFMDSSGLGLILGRYTKLKAIGGKLTVKNPTSKTEEILRLAGTEKIIPIEKGDNANEK